MPRTPICRPQGGLDLVVKHGLARVRLVDQVPIPEPVEVRLTAIELDEHVIPAPVVRDGVEGLMQIGHEVNDPLESVLADGPALGGIVEPPEKPLGNRDHAATLTIALGVIA